MHPLKRLLLATAFTFSALSPAIATESVTSAKLYFITPADGAQLSSPVTIKFGLFGMGVAPAGVDKKNTGHHHLLIDLDTLPKLNLPLPKDAQHKHFGGGQTETSLELTPGQHTLQLLLGDMNHMPHSPAVLSEKITITVK